MSSKPVTRVMLVHNFYQQSGGEDSVFRNEARLLVDRGVQVTTSTRSNDELKTLGAAGKVGTVLGTIWSRTSRRSLLAKLETVRPDLVHFHNTFPLVSPSAYRACADFGVPVVQTLHNYRLACAGATLFRDGRPCEDCIGGSLLPALMHRCYRGSLAGTGVVVGMLSVNRALGSYRRLVHRYIALTRFAAQVMQRAGLPPDRIALKPNFLPRPPAAGHGGGGYGIFVGRLSEEKGVADLVDAWRAVSGIRLKIVGDGPLYGTLQRVARESGVAIDFLGRRTHKEVVQLVSHAEFLVVPSRWYEGFPMVVVESYACGTPVIASRLGGLNEVVAEGVSGLKFKAGDPADLASRVMELMADPDRRMSMRSGARRLFDDQFGEERNFHTLMTIYEAARDQFEHDRAHHSTAVVRLPQERQ